MSRARDNRGRPPRPRPGTGPGAGSRSGQRFEKPPLRVFTTTLWEYPSQDYAGFTRNLPAGAPPPDADETPGPEPMAGATPSWVVWQLLTRYTRANDLVVDPMAGSGTTLDVARDLGRRALSYDLTPRRPDIFRADARKLPLEDAKADFIFIDPPYSTHLTYSDNPRDIGALDAADDGEDAGYYDAMDAVFREAHRVLRDRRYLGVYVSDSWRKRKGGEPGSGVGTFMPIGFELFARLRRLFKPVDVVCVVRHNAKLRRGNWHAAAEEGNFFLRGFNYLLILKKEAERRGDEEKS